VVNIDDPTCRQLHSASNAQAITTYSIENPEADIYAHKIEYSAEGFSAQINSPWGEAAISCNLVGHFNVSNVIASIAVCCTLGEEFQKVCESVAWLTPVPGRLQKVQFDTAGAPQVFIDYAHTPDALQSVLTALQPQVKHKLWVVFGC